MHSKTQISNIHAETDMIVIFSMDIVYLPNEVRLSMNFGSTWKKNAAAIKSHVIK